MRISTEVLNSIGNLRTEQDDNPCGVSPNRQNDEECERAVDFVIVFPY